MRYKLITALLAAFIAGPAVVRAQSMFSTYSVTVPALPETLDFAGEPVPLGNYDTRESMRRELLVTSYMHSRTFLTLLNSKRYISQVYPIMKKYDIPYDFIYLCMAESGLDPEVVSVAGAGGLWQIMPATARGYGLSVGKDVDERFDVEKATEAACKYLREAYDEFGSWTLAAASYNLGKAGLRKRLDIQGTTDYYDTWLPAETLRYLFRVLSFKLICENPHRYGFTISDADYYPPLTNYTRAQAVGTPISWPQVAKDNGTTYKVLRHLNPWIRDYESPNKSGKSYTVKVPAPDFRSSNQQK